jgi:CIC family chloride channel protein
VVTVPESATLERILWVFKTENAPYLHVIDEQGQLTGIISFRDIRPVLYEQDLLQLVIAKDLATTELETVTMDDTLQDALDKLTSRGVSQLPVLESATSRRLSGTLTEHALNTAYSQQLLRKEIDTKE